jgi:ATP-dependent Clp protease ATP-binding subunit ClpA
MIELSHLDDTAKAALTLSNEQRIHWIRQSRWIPYTRAKQIIDKLEDLLTYPEHHRMPCLLIIGETNNGKSAIINRFQRSHKASDNPEGDSILLPVLTVQAPPVPEENRFYATILEALQAPYRPSDSAARRQTQVIRILRAAKLRMLIIDELHHIVAGHIGKQRVFLNVLKYLANELRIPLIGVGTVDAVRAVQSDPQLANRFEPVGLPAWELNREFQMLLASFERTFPLKKPSHLANEQLATMALALSEGTIGELGSLLTAAASCAIETGQERITEKLLRSLPWDPPSIRKRGVERLS